MEGSAERTADGLLPQGTSGYRPRCEDRHHEQEYDEKYEARYVDEYVQGAGQAHEEDAEPEDRIENSVAHRCGGAGFGLHRKAVKPPLAIGTRHVSRLPANRAN